MACRKVYLDAYYAKNHDRDNARKTKWRKENPDKAKAAIEKWTEGNKDRIKLVASEWVRNNPEKRDEINKRWRTLNVDKIKSASANYYSANKEKKSAYNYNYRLENKDKISAGQRKYRLLNKDKLIAKESNRLSKNPEYFRLKNHSYRARKKGNGGRLSKDLIKKLFKLQRGKCACCSEPLGDDYHLDHRLPLALGGSNTDDNMQLLTATCNLQKGAKHPVDFMQSRGFLL